MSTAEFQISLSVEVLQIILCTIETQDTRFSVHFLYGEFDAGWETILTQKARPIGGLEFVSDQRLICEKETLAKETLAVHEKTPY